MLNDIAVIPGYREIYGRPCTREDLVDILRRFSVNDWLCNLARLACLLAGSRHLEKKWYSAFLKAIVPGRVAKRLEEWDREETAEGHKVAVFTERYIGILIELAIVYSPEEAGPFMECPGDGSILDALLMLANLEEPDTSKLASPDKPRKVASTFMTLGLRSLCPDPQWLAARGFHIFRIMQDRPEGSHAQEWAGLFKDATGQDVDAYFAGGLQTLSVAWGPVYPRPCRKMAGLATLS